MERNGGTSGGGSSTGDNIGSGKVFYIRRSALIAGRCIGDVKDRKHVKASNVCGNI
jgi:hypothetical protein